MRLLACKEAVSATLLTLQARCLEHQFLHPHPNSLPVQYRGIPTVLFPSLILGETKHRIAETMRDDVLSVRISMSESPVRPGSSVGTGADHFSSTTKSHYQDQLREGLSFKPTVYHKVCRWRLKHLFPT